MPKLTRTRQKMKQGHRAVKPRIERPLDVAKAGNHAERHEQKKRDMAQRAAEAAMGNPITDILLEQATAPE